MIRRCVAAVLARIRRQQPQRPDAVHATPGDARLEALLAVTEQLVSATESDPDNRSARAWAFSAIESLEALVAERLFRQDTPMSPAAQVSFLALLAAADDPVAALVAEHERAADPELRAIIRTAGAGVAVSLEQRRVREAENRAGHLAARRFRAAIASQLDAVDPGARILAHDVPSLRGRIETTTTNRS